MTISSQILDAMRADYSTMTQDELAKKYGIDQQSVSRFFSGKRKVSGMKVSTLERMFPNATISLTGAGSVGQNSGTVNNFLPSSSLDSVLSAVMADADIPDAVKVKIYNLIQKEKSK